MKDVLALLRAEPRARLFFATLTQSALGTGAAYPALLLIAYERYESPWAISLILVADLVPAMLLGPIFGAAADRWSRRTCAVASDVVRAGAFVGVALADSFTMTLAFATLAGAGTGMFTPATLAGIPSLVHKSRVPAATSLYGAIADLGFTAGPALAAPLLIITGAEEIILLNGITFALSAVVLTRLPLGGGTDTEARPAGRVIVSLLRETREGLGVVRRMRGVRTVVAGSAAALFFGGLFNVGELLFVTEELGSSDAGYSALVALFGLGFIVGSLAGSKGGSPYLLRRRFLQGVGLMGLGFLLSGLAPSFAIALVTFTLAGFGNGLLLVHERVIVQDTVPDRLLGRAFGVKDALASWAFGSAFFAAGGLLTAIDSRQLIIGAGVGGLVIAVACAVALRREGLPEEARHEDGWLGRRGDAARDLRAHEESADVVGGSDLRPALLDRLDER